MLRAEVASVVLAGMDTTGHQLSWIFGMLATHPRVTQKLVEELRENGFCGADRKEVTLEALSGLPYLNAVIKEGFRIAYTIRFSVFPRRLPKDMSVFGYRVPKGIRIISPGNRAMNAVSDWGDPDVVRPERWLTGEDMSSKFFQTFGYGPRECPGQRLAMLEIRLVIVTLLSKYHLSTASSFEFLLENVINGVMIECKGGMLLDVSLRKENEIDD